MKVIYHTRTGVVENSKEKGYSRRGARVIDNRYGAGSAEGPGLADHFWGTELGNITCCTLLE
jgi:hypothetical protein